MPLFKLYGNVSILFYSTEFSKHSSYLVLLKNCECVHACVRACVCVYLVYEETNLYNDMGMT